MISLTKCKLYNKTFLFARFKLFWRTAVVIKLIIIKSLLRNTETELRVPMVGINFVPDALPQIFGQKADF